MPDPLPYLVGGKENFSKETMDIINPYTGKLFKRVCCASKTDIGKAVEKAQTGFQKTKKISSMERSNSLSLVAQEILKNKDELAMTITSENGKTIKDSRMETERAAATFQLASEEAKRIAGEEIPMDLRQDALGRIGFVQRFPIGPILGITPFNFPLNLSCHKIAPALACGNTFIHRPSSITPVSALILGNIIARTGLPPEAISVLPSHHEEAQMLIDDERIRMISFTGGPSIGWEIKQHCGRKKIALELGGNGCVIVHEDADMNLAVNRCLRGAFAYAGQVCISVQRIYIHESIYQAFIALFLKATSTLKMGDPASVETDIGPLISEKEAIRAQSWIQQALKSGGELLTGGKRQGSFIEPTVLSKVPTGTRICDEEAFAPVVLLYPYQDFNEAVQNINQTPYGLQAGIFTRNIERIISAYREIDVGAVMVNEVPTFRLEHMPYGGTKLSGLGREGVKYAIQEMTEPKLLIIKAS